MDDLVYFLLWASCRMWIDGEGHGRPRVIVGMRVCCCTLSVITNEELLLTNSPGLWNMLRGIKLKLLLTPSAIKI